MSLDPGSFDPDEDLFNFDEITSGDPAYQVDDDDLDAIFAAFNESEVAGFGGGTEFDPATDSWGPDAAGDPHAALDPMDAGASAAASGHGARGGGAGPQGPDAGLGQHAGVAAPAPGAHPAGRAPTHDFVASDGAPSGAPSVVLRSSRGMAVILLAITSLNALVAFVTLKNTGEMRTSVMQGVQQVSQTAEEIRRGALAEVQGFHSVSMPLVPPDPENHPTFELVRDDIESGAYATARQRLYSLLAIVDRLDEGVRSKIEARANYLLAQALHLEAVSRMGDNL